ncbi:tripartite tricarboxylate transporter substrate binding protein [Teichococcus aerofrigidensis]
MPYHPLRALSRRRLLALSGVTLGAASLSRPALAQGRFPDRPIRLILPWPPGGSSDAQIRSLADLATRTLGQPVLIENRSGARGLLGAQQLLQAAPDGYTLSQHHLSVLRHPFLTRAKSWDPVEDFTPVIGLTGWLFGVVVRGDSPYKDWASFVAAAKAKPGLLTYSTSGIGTTNHIAMEDLCSRAGIELTHVPFRGTTEGVTALMGRQIDSIADSSAWMPQAEAGTFRALCVWTAERVSRLPDVPTLRELGHDMVVTSPYGIAGPKGMDPGVVRALHDAFRTALFSPENTAIRDRWDMPLAYLDSEAYRDFVVRRAAYEKEMVTRLNLSIDS